MFVLVSDLPPVQILLYSQSRVTHSSVTTLLSEVQMSILECVRFQGAMYIYTGFIETAQLLMHFRLFLHKVSVFAEYTRFEKHTLGKVYSSSTQL